MVRAAMSPILLALTVGGLVMSAHAKNGPGPDAGTFFENRDALDEGLTELLERRAFVIDEFVHDEAMVLVARTGFASGPVTTYFRVYRKIRSGFELLLIRETVWGDATITDRGDALVFSSEDIVFLILPWEGIKDVESWPNRSDE